MRRRSKKTSGFVAVEVLVGLAITAFVLTAAMQLTVRFFRSDTALAAVRLDEDAIRRTHGVLRRSFERFILGSQGELVSPPVAGSATRLDFISAGPEALAAREPLSLSFQIVGERGRADLVIDWRPVTGGPSQRETLFSGARSLSFDYLAPGARAPWVQSWSDTARPPSPVRLTVQGSATPSIELVVAVRPELAALCLAKPMARECQ